MSEQPKLSELSSEQKYALVRANYAGIAADYNNKFGDVEEVYKIPLEDFCFASESGGEVLVVGGGTELRFLNERGFSVTDLDISKEMLDEAKKLAPTIKTVLGSIVDPPLPAESVTGVVAYNSLIHLAPVDLPRALRSIKNVLAPSGNCSFIFTVPEMQTRGYIEELVPDPDFEGEGLWYYRTLYSYAFMAQMMSINGLQIRKSEVKFIEAYSETQAVIHAVKTD